MNQEILFAETQGFDRKWIRLAMAISLASGLILLLPVIKKDLENAGWVFVLFLFSLLAILILSLRLETIIQTDGIYVRFYPFHRKYYFYPWHSIKQCYVKNYNPVREYGGWGIRYGFGRNGRALNFSGSQGIQLVFTDGSKLLIGTRKAEEADEVIQKLES